MIQVLIIEDDVRIAEINRRFVEKVPGYQVIGIATDEPQAREQLEILQPDLVLLDLYFPDMSGLDMLRYINGAYAETDVIMITAAKEVDAVKQAIRGGAYDFIVKPMIFERFAETLRQYREYRAKIAAFATSKEQVGQAEIDALWRGVRQRERGPKDDLLPKGIDKLTLDKVYAVLKTADTGLTAEQAGAEIGASRSTARRYLEFLVAQGEVAADLSYGVVGRPERVYGMVRKK